VLLYKVTGSVNVRIVMRVKYLNGVALLLFLLVGIASETRAQDEVPGPDMNSINNQEPAVYDEKPLLYESEGRTSKSSTTDSIQSKPSAVMPMKKGPSAADLRKPKDEDPLNFNFLFYIITKFKSSDLMEE
jgi:hypothetical protein